MGLLGDFLKLIGDAANSASKKTNGNKPGGRHYCYAQCCRNANRGANGYGV